MSTLEALIARIQASLARDPWPGPEALAELLAGPLDAAALTPRARFGEERYTREVVASAPGWELRMLAWRPGQGSALHGHGRSSCAFRVLRGEAEELRPGGGRRVLVTGAVGMAGPEVVHQVSNATDAPLITLHLYVPPLPVDQPSGPDGARIVVVGGGFCGAALAVHLLRRAGPELRLTLVERGGRPGRGVAYGTSDPQHLLNVPAIKMSLDPDDPGAFLRFALDRGLRARPTDLLPRALYGEYLAWSLEEEARARPGRLRVASAEAVDVDDGGVQLADGRRLPADQVVLATGHLQPRWPEGIPELVRGDPRLTRDAWEPGALDELSRDARVLVVGMGLTAVDVLLSLRGQGHRGPVLAISRGGRWPEAHLPGVFWTGPAPSLPLPAPREAEALAWWLRAAIVEAEAAQIPWQAVIDALRPEIPAIWAALPEAERGVFLARYRARWELLRHRASASTLASLSFWESTGQLQALAAEIRAVQATPEGLCVDLGTETGPRIVTVDRVILCTGADTDIRRAANPALRALLARGRIQADPLGLGLEVDAHGRALNAEGQVNPRLWVLGAARRPRLWETTAVPELARQAATLASALLAACRPEISPGGNWS